MTSKRRRWVIAVALVALGVAVYAGCGPWDRVRRTGLARDEFTARYDGLTLPPTATDVSVYVQNGWGDEHVVIAFTVPDEPTFVDWVTPLLGPPAFFNQGTVLEFDGDRLYAKKLSVCLSALRGDRETEYITYAVYELPTRRVYYQKAHRSRLEE